MNGIPNENEKKVDRIYAGQVDDRLKVMDKFKVDYQKIYDRQNLFKKIIYLNGITFVVGVQGTGKTYLVKSILNNPEVHKELNNVFWIDTPNDLVFISKWLFAKKVCFEGLNLLFQNKLKGEYFERWDSLTEQTHMYVNEERFDFLPFDPLKFDIVVLDDVAKFPDMRLLIQYATTLRHIHCGMIFISQTEGILAKAFRDLASVYITFNTPDTKVITNARNRRQINNLIEQKNSKREAVLVDLVDNKISIISAEEPNAKKDEEKMSISENKSEEKDSEISTFDSQLKQANV